MLIDDYCRLEGYKLYTEKINKPYSKYSYARNINWIKLSDLKGEGHKWKFREVESFDLETSLPTYFKDAGGVEDRKRLVEQRDVDKLNQILAKYDISTKERIRHFLSQCDAESELGIIPIEQYTTGDNPTEDPKILKYYTDPEIRKRLGNTELADSYKYRGAGAIQITGREGYTEFSRYLADNDILDKGALYVGQMYFWEASAYYWSVFKPNSANDNSFDLNGKCDSGSNSLQITQIVNGGENKKDERAAAYEYYKNIMKPSLPEQIYA